MTDRGRAKSLFGPYKLTRALPPPEAARRTGRSLAAAYGRRRDLGLPDARAGRQVPRKGGRAAP